MTLRLILSTYLLSGNACERTALESVPRGGMGVLRKEEGSNLMGHKFTLRGTTSAFYQQGPDSVTGGRLSADWPLGLLKW